MLIRCPNCGKPNPVLLKTGLFIAETDSIDEILSVSVCLKCEKQRQEWYEKKRRQVGPCNGYYGHFLTTLHIGFLCVEETEEHIKRLRNEPLIDGIATTSKISNQQQVLRPIDRTAAIVVKRPT